MFLHPNTGRISLAFSAYGYFLCICGGIETDPVCKMLASLCFHRQMVRRGQLLEPMAEFDVERCWRDSAPRLPTLVKILIVWTPQMIVSGVCQVHLLKTPVQSIDMFVCRFCDAIWITKPVDSKRFSMGVFLFSYVSLCSFTLLQVAFIFVLTTESEVYIICM